MKIEEESRSTVPRLDDELGKDIIRVAVEDDLGLTGGRVRGLSEDPRLVDEQLGRDVSVLPV